MMNNINNGQSHLHWLLLAPISNRYIHAYCAYVSVIIIVRSIYFFFYLLSIVILKCETFGFIFCQFSNRPYLALIPWGPITNKFHQFIFHWAFNECGRGTETETFWLVFVALIHYYYQSKYIGV